MDHTSLLRCQEERLTEIKAMNEDATCGSSGVEFGGWRFVLWGTAAGMGASGAQPLCTFITFIRNRATHFVSVWNRTPNLLLSSDLHMRSRAPCMCTCSNHSATADERLSRSEKMDVTRAGLSLCASMVRTEGTDFSVKLA